MGIFKKLKKLITYEATYAAPKTDSSLRSKVVKPEKWKEPSYKNYNWGKGVGK